jgi:hypothetical protein
MSFFKLWQGQKLRKKFFGRYFLHQVRKNKQTKRFKKRLAVKGYKTFFFFVTAAEIKYTTPFVSEFFKG